MFMFNIAFRKKYVQTYNIFKKDSKQKVPDL